MTTSTSTPRTGPARPAAEATIPAASDSADRRRWLMLAVLITGQFMALLDVTIVNVAIPTIHAKLNASGAAIQLVVAGYTITYAMLLITGARLGDLRGHRNVFLAGLATFTIASLACGLAPNTGAQVSGGVLVSANLFGASWRPVFLVNVPVGLAAALLVPRLVPADHVPGGRRLDLTGLATASTAVLAIVLPLVLGHQEGWPTWTWASLGAGVALSVVFVLVERSIAARGGDPLLNLGVFGSPGLAAGLVALAAAMIGYGGFLFSFALHLQLGLGDSALRAGLTFAPGAAAFGAAGYWWRRLPSRIHHVLTPIGLAVGTLAYLGLALDLRGGGRGGPWLLLILVVYGAAFGAAFSPLVTQSLVRVPRSEAADASGLLTTTIQLSQVIGVAVFGSLFLTLAAHPGAHASATAFSTVNSWVAALTVLGIAGGVERRPARIDRVRLPGVLLGDVHPHTPWRVLAKMPGQRPHGPRGVVAWRQPDADLRASARSQRVGGVGHPGRVDRQHRRRRLGPDPPGEAAGPQQLDAVEQAGLGPEPLLGVVEIGGLGGHQPVDGDVALLVVQARQHPAQGRQRVRGRAAVDAGVDAVLEDPHLDHAVDQAAQGGGERGRAGLEVGGVGQHDDVGRQLAAVALQQRPERGRADLLLALDEHGHPDRRPPVVGAQHRQVRGDPGLVVGGPAAVQAPIPFDRRERRAGPGARIAGRLDVMVGVEQDGRLARWRRAAGEHRGLAALDAVEDLDLGRPGAAEQPGRHLRAATHLRRGAGIGAHGRDLDQGFEVAPDARKGLSYRLAKRIAHRPGLLVRLLAQVQQDDATSDQGRGEHAPPAEALAEDGGADGGGDDHAGLAERGDRRQRSAGPHSTRP